MTARPPRWAGRVLLALGGPALLAGHTLAHCAGLDLADFEAWRRLWSDEAVAIAAWIDATHGAAPPSLVVSGPAAETRAREVLLQRIERDGLRPTRPLAIIAERPFVRERLAPERNRYDDKGRAVLLSLSFRLRRGIAPFLILWLGWLAVTPVLAWTAIELGAAGQPRAAGAFLVLLGVSPFVAETLALPRYAVGFYLVGLLTVVPLAAYAQLGRAPTLRGLGARAAASGLALALCMYCRSSAVLLLPGYVLAVWLGARRVLRSPWRRAAVAAVAAVFFALPWLALRQAGHHDVWEVLWEGLGDFDRDKGHAWSDAVAEKVARAGGAEALWTPEADAVLRARLRADVAADPAWYVGILARRLAATVTLWKLWPWHPGGGPPFRPSTSPNEGLMDKYWGYTTTIDHVGFGPARLEIPVPLMLAPALAVAVIAFNRRFASKARRSLLVVACVALAGLALPVIVTTAGGQETQAFGVAYLLAAAFAAELVLSRDTEPDGGR